MKIVNGAYTILSDKEMRACYDKNDKGAFNLPNDDVFQKNGWIMVRIKTFKLFCLFLLAERTFS